MRRPAKTKAQRAHDKQQRALLRLRKAAVIYSALTSDGHKESLVELKPGREKVHHSDMLANLEAACDAYTNTLTVREARKLIK